MLQRMNFASTLAANQRLQPRARRAAVPPDAGTRPRVHAGALPHDGIHDGPDGVVVRVPAIDGLDRQPTRNSNNVFPDSRT
jgi:hypothetical protein